MRACTVAPGRPETAGVEEIAEPAAETGEVLVEGLLVGVCGTDVEISSAGYGWPPPGHERIVLFHESLGRVLEAPADSGLAPGANPPGKPWSHSHSPIRPRICNAQARIAELSGSRRRGRGLKPSFASTSAPVPTPSPQPP